MEETAPRSPSTIGALPTNPPPYQTNENLDNDNVRRRRNRTHREILQIRLTIVQRTLAREADRSNSSLFDFFNNDANFAIPLISKHCCSPTYEIRLGIFARILCCILIFAIFTFLLIKILY